MCSADPVRTRLATIPAGDRFGANSCRKSWMARMVRSVPATEKRPGSATRDMVAGGPGHACQAVQRRRAVNQDEGVVLRAGQDGGEPAQVAAAEVRAVIDSGVGRTDGNVQDRRAGTLCPPLEAAVPPSRWIPRSRQDGPPGALEHPADVRWSPGWTPRAVRRVGVGIEVDDSVGIPAASAADASPVVTEVLPTPPLRLLMLTTCT